jgi:hypothetical protein
MKKIALDEEKILLDQLDSGQAKLLKENLILLMKMLAV